MSRAGWFGMLAGAAAALALAFLILPIVAILTDVGPARLLHSLSDRSAREALALSAETVGVAMVVILGLGTPVAYFLARAHFSGRALVSALLELPLVLPPAAAGIGLLAAFGPRGLLGPALSGGGVELPLTQAAVVTALCFVAGPLYLRQAQAAFAAVDERLLEAARTLGASPARTFARVAVPTAREGLAAGGALALARALGEFGATLIFAGSLPGVTQTAPLAIYDRFASDFTGALALAAVLLCVSGAVLVAIKVAGGGVALARG